VTGVQTCALPISTAEEHAFEDRDLISADAVDEGNFTIEREDRVPLQIPVFLALERKVDRVDITTESGVGEAGVELVTVARLDAAIAGVVHIVYAKRAAQVIAADVFLGEF
jgi:hypothetical protein